ncbi:MULTISPECIES: sigma-70 family RNA polymerase sigma factor [unclassified Bradyrhizobium]|uniref:sigma-70 family RNA polymerase sigma factor n=1 Tax=unclassified Bradyrhizobium TaxID=2631580 RepID=UPI001BA71B46|nr:MULTISPECIES: sigma-70 family RNA polymerase sigma factor [unclassified Bradyrhizobium]MBR1208131.1 sigma-70 family RNA polymerase sigma factor [Bradyrhizobium sp. AUGA SZCCT0124]MBR1316460.1 sigma-70 family RNA polymerase sigma factor [Bradyrhizobium sp. AUGA SZCCT0051]MBR1344645.1 sigma-70 family RNA polymerase sigma factor [Bradyrhizobium sp. AUGA SZCCT0105]MBR1359481.1 sigma-70 family RNA polymerase sigma factor [Bradyrhizobium sp. AUGA SZCCT0045]
MTSNESELRGLMIAGLNGDSAAHRALLGRLSKHLRAYYRSRMPSYARGDSDAEDLVQEALIAIHTRRHTYDPKQLLTPWVYAIARYKLIDYLRRNRASRANVPIEDAGELTAQDDSVASESMTDLGRLMAQLPPKMRRAIQYVKLDGLSVSEAAARSGMSESAVKVNIHRGLKALSASISREPEL